MITFTKTEFEGGGGRRIIFKKGVDTPVEEVKEEPKEEFIKEKEFKV